MIRWKTIFINFFGALVFLSLCFGADQLSELGFANQLRTSGELLPAIEVYQRIIYFNSDQQNKAQAKLGLAKTYFALQEYSKSETLLNEIIENNTTQAKVAQYELAREYYIQQKFDLAALEFKDYGDTYRDDTALYLSGWSYLNNYDYAKSALVFSKLTGNPSSNYTFAAKKLLTELPKGPLLPQKNVGLAQFFSYVLPGSGQIYAHNYADGVVSFLANGLTTSLAANAIAANRSGEALIWIILESAWYFGGVYSAGNSAEKFNEQTKQKFVQDLQTEYHLSEILEK